MMLLIKNIAKTSQNIIYKIYLIIKKLIAIFRAMFVPEALIPFPSNNYAFETYKKEQIRLSYENFKKYFPTTIFLSGRKIKLHALNKASENDIDQKHLYLEFGVWYGLSINKLAKLLKTNIYGFDSFVGLKEDWIGNHLEKGTFKLDRLPTVLSNVKLIKGWFQETLEDFLKEKKTKINFIHLDCDTYEATHYVLKTIKPYLVNNAIITFDDHHNHENWDTSEWKALNEVFSNDEFKYMSFAKDDTQATIQVKIK